MESPRKAAHVDPDSKSNASVTVADDAKPLSLSIGSRGGKHHKQFVFWERVTTLTRRAGKPLPRSNWQVLLHLIYGDDRCNLLHSVIVSIVAPSSTSISIPSAVAVFALVVHGNQVESGAELADCIVGQSCLDRLRSRCFAQPHFN